MKNFSELLEDFRKLQGISKKELAERTGLTPGYISHLTGGRNTPSRETVELLARALQLSGERRAEFFQAANYPLAEEAGSLAKPSNVQREDWGEAPNIRVFYGRKRELAELSRWITSERCQMITIVGMGGIGKTALAAKLVEQTRQRFDFIFWRSLQNAPRLESLLRDCLQFLAGQHPKELPEEWNEQISVLLTLLRQHRCLIVFDNVESILQGKELAGQYREDYEGYGRLFRLLGETKHESCLILTSREKPKDIAFLEGKLSASRLWSLRGVGDQEGQKILEETGLEAPDDSWPQLIRLYSGNPLALKLVSEYIREVFGGSVANFLAKKEVVFGDIHVLLDQQFNRLSTLEREIIYWLAIEREPLSLETLQADLIEAESERDIFMALGSLRRRSMIETLSTSQIYLQPVIIEYVTEELVQRIYAEIKEREIALLEKIALIKAQAKDYIRENQVSFILAPLISKLLTTVGREKSEKRLKEILSSLRETRSPGTGYAAGNVLNLFIQLGSNLAGLDFSHLVVRQAYLKGVDLHEVNFAYADLKDSIFTDTFGSILSVALSLNGEILAVGTANGEVRLVDVASGTSLRLLYGHTDAVRSVTFSPDGQTLASGGDDQTIRLWNVRTGQPLKTLHEHSGWVWSVAFSPDGRTLASGSDDRTIRLWDAHTGQSLKTLTGHQSRTYSVTFSIDGILLASGGEDQTIRLWDVGTGQSLKILTGHTSRVISVTFSPDGRTLASSSDDQTIHLWDVHTGQNVKVLRGHVGRVSSVAFNTDGALLASGGEDQAVRLWDVDTGQSLKTLAGHSSRVISVTFSPDGRTLASGSDDQTVRLWDVSTGHSLRTLTGHSSRVRALAFSPRGTLLASGSEDQMIRLWEGETGRALKTLAGHRSWVRSVAFSPDGQMLASGSEDQTIRLWDAGTGHTLRTLRGHTYQVRSVAFSPDGQMLASGSEDQTIRLWDARTGLLLKTLEGHSNRIWSVAFSPDGQVLASSSDDRTIRLWDARTGLLLKTLEGHSARIYSVAFSPDGKMLASGSADQTIRLWDVSSGQALKTLEKHAGWVWSVAFSPDGKMLASGGADRSVRLWNIQTGSCLWTQWKHSSSVYAVAFSSNGAHVGSGSDDGTIRLWQAQSGESLNVLRGARPYERMNIAHASGLTETQREVLKALGAIEEE